MVCFNAFLRVFAPVQDTFHVMPCLLTDMLRTVDAIDRLESCVEGPLKLIRCSTDTPWWPVYVSQG